MTSIYIPITKGNQNKGESLYWAKQDGPSNPENALKKHLKINSPPVEFHLFGYPNAKGIMLPLSKKTFITRVSKATTIAGLPWIKGHSIHIGATLEYLLRGLPFNMMKVKGCWNTTPFTSTSATMPRLWPPTCKLPLPTFTISSSVSLCL